MFEKLLSVLPYNPSLAHQLSFYSRRMREEAAIRRIGVFFLVLAFMVQFMAVLSPPQPTSASSSNDLINGGISSANDARNRCNQNDEHYGDIVNYFGISCADIAAANTVTLQSTGDANYYSMGRNSYGQHNPTTGRNTNETPLNVPGPQGKIYVRLLHSFDSGPYSSYKALKVKSSVNGRVYFILYDCGNLVSAGIPNPPNRCKWNNNLFASDNKCFQPCRYDHSIPADNNRCFQPCPIKGLGNVPKDSPKCHQPCPYNKKISADSQKCFQPCKYNKNIPSDSQKCFQPCQYNSSIPSNSPECKPCDKASKSNPAACVSIHKAASNITAKIADANDTTANPGDVITYTLSAQNTGKADVKGFVFQEDLNDVLDYADITDLHGGTMNTNKSVSWPAQTIKAGKTASHQITIKVKDPVPQTPAAPGDPNHFDLVMTNVYGDTINIKLPGSPAKTIEGAAATLPNTGPGTSLMVAAAIVIIGGYFYGRARLLADESSLAVQESLGA
jgi:uncharacterized repeat protein (TIGR01451 family)